MLDRTTSQTRKTTSKALSTPMISACIRLRVWASSAPAGSSIDRMCGSIANVRAIARDGRRGLPRTHLLSVLSERFSAPFLASQRLAEKARDDHIIVAVALPERVGACFLLAAAA